MMLEDEDIFLPGEKGKTARMLGAMKNISEKKKIEEELRLSEEKFRILYEYAPEAFYLSDLKGVFLEGNQAVEKLLGYKREEMLGKNFLAINVLPIDQALKAAALLARNILGQSTGPDEFTLARKDKSKVLVEITTHLVRFMGRTMVLGVVRDISEQKKADIEIKKRAEELEKMNKFMVGREMTMIELKKEINSLLKELGRPEKYRT
jgi:PAS domain S-box-containing protein